MRTALWTPLALTLAMLGNSWLKNAQAAPAKQAKPTSAEFFGSEIAGEKDSRASTDWKQVFDQLFYWNIGKFPRCDVARFGINQFTPDLLRQDAMYYPGQSTVTVTVDGKNYTFNQTRNFNSTYKQIREAAALVLIDPQSKKPVIDPLTKMPKKVFTTNDIVNLREALLGDIYATKSSLVIPSKEHSPFGIASVASTDGTEAQQFASSLQGQIAEDGRSSKVDGSSRNPYLEKWKTNFFSTPEGQKVMSLLHGVTVVVVPGFASHTIPFYTYAEIVEDADEYYCRSTKVNDKGQLDPNGHVRHIRIVGDDGHGNPTYGAGQSPQEYYGQPCKDFGFDIVHPMGRELGNTMGPDEIAASHLATFVRGLPDNYKNQKLVFLGYSKGTPLTHNMLLDPANNDIRARTLAIVTLAGVNQGAITAEDAIRSLKVALEEKARDDAQAKENSDAQTENRKPKTVEAPSISMEAAVNTITASQNVSINDLFAARSNDPEIASRQSTAAQEAQTLFALATASSEFSAAQSTAQRNASLQDRLGQLDLQQTEAKEDLQGVLSMTNYERIKWNLLTLSNDNPKMDQSELSILSLSVLTNRGDWSDPEQTVGPRFARGLPNALDISHFSLDNQFLFWTSLSMFETSPAGMADTQVAWADTKPMALDRRPLSESLLPSELKDLFKEVNDAHPGLLQEKYNGVPFQDIPRDKLFALTRNSLSHLNFVDLGEVRGTHWNIAFRQVYRFSSIPGAPDGTSVMDGDPEKSCSANPDGYKGYEHVFPRKAMLASLLETLALYVNTGTQK